MIANGRLYIRETNSLWGYDVKARKNPHKITRKFRRAAVGGSGAVQEMSGPALNRTKRGQGRLTMLFMERQNNS